MGGVLTEDGSLKLWNRGEFAEALKRLKPGRVVITVTPLADKRSLDQNAYLHAVPFPLLAEEFGCSVEDVKYDLMGEKWGWKPSPLNPNHFIPVMPHTSDMTVEQCTEFIEWLIPWALDKFGISIPYPNEVAA